MPRKITCLAELRAKKQALLMESELNRVQLLREWSNLKTTARQVANPLRAAKKIASSTATAATAFAIARRIFKRSVAPKHLWINSLISGAKVGASIVSLLRARRR